MLRSQSECITINEHIRIIRNTGGYITDGCITKAEFGDIWPAHQSPSWSHQWSSMWQDKSVIQAMKQNAKLGKKIPRNRCRGSSARRARRLDDLSDPPYKLILNLWSDYKMKCGRRSDDMQHATCNMQVQHVLWYGVDDSLVGKWRLSRAMTP